jgi:hypothetical protein
MPHIKVPGGRRWAALLVVRGNPSSGLTLVDWDGIETEP